MWNDRRHLLGRQAIFLPVGPSSSLPQDECSSSVLWIHKTSRDAASFQGSKLRNSPAVDAFLQLGNSAGREAAHPRGTGSLAVLWLECRRRICQKRFSCLHTDSLCSLMTCVLQKHDLNWCVLAETGWEISGSCSLCLFPPSLLMMLNCWRDGSMQLSEESFQSHHQNQLHGPLSPHGGRSWNSREMTLLSACEMVLYIEWHSGMGYLQNRYWKNRENKTNLVDTSTSKCSNQGNKKVIQRKIQWLGCLVLYTQSILVLKGLLRSGSIACIQKIELSGITLNIFRGLKKIKILWGGESGEMKFGFEKFYPGH